MELTRKACKPEVVFKESCKHGLDELGADAGFVNYQLTLQSPAPIHDQDQFRASSLLHAGSGKRLVA